MVTAITSPHSSTVPSTEEHGTTTSTTTQSTEITDGPITSKMTEITTSPVQPSAISTTTVASSSYITSTSIESETTGVATEFQTTSTSNMSTSSTTSEIATSTTATTQTETSSSGTDVTSATSEAITTTMVTAITSPHSSTVPSTEEHRTTTSTTSQSTEVTDGPITSKMTESTTSTIQPTAISTTTVASSSYITLTNIETETTGVATEFQTSSTSKMSTSSATSEIATSTTATTQTETSSSATDETTDSSKAVPTTVITEATQLPLNITTINVSTTITSTTAAITNTTTKSTTKTSTRLSSTSTTNSILPTTSTEVDITSTISHLPRTSLDTTPWISSTTKLPTTPQITTPTTAPTTEVLTPTSATTRATTSSTITTTLRFSYGLPQNDLKLTNVDDACSSAVTSSLPLPVYGMLYTQMHICSNGIVSFSERFTTPNPPRSDHDFQQHSYLAPYFTDLDLQPTGSFQGAIIYYHAYDVIRNYALSTHENVVKARDFVRSSESDQGHFTPTFLLLVTWDKVYPYPAYSRQSEDVSFQLVVVTDGLNTFALYIYFQDQMNMKYNEVFVGYAFKVPGIVKRDLNSFTSRAWAIDKYVQTNGQRGILYYRLTPQGYQISNDQRVCLSWWSQNLGNRNFYERMNNNMPSCPCSLSWLWWDSSFGNDYFVNSNTYCSVIRSRWWYGHHGKTCCYDWRTRQYMQTAPRAGGFQEYHKITYAKQHQAIDARMKEYCCHRTNLCHLYYQLRPVSRCYNVFPFFFAIFWGDPHIETLDKRKFTFNGWGEYTLVSLDTGNITFQLQSRTARAEKADGNLTDATIFSAFAAKDNHGANVHVELNENKDGLVIFAKSNKNASSFDDYTSDFADLSREFDVNDPFVSLIRDTASKTLTAIFSSGISFNVSLGVRMLTVSVVLPTDLKQKPKGLLGNFDDDPNNDFMFPNGTSLPPSPSERAIFYYGQSWEVNGHQSVFHYPPGKNHSDFHHKDFVPKFLDEADPVKVAAAKTKCDKDNQECIFDLVFTENEAIANNTRNVETRASSGQTELENNAPTIFGNGTVYATLGERVNVVVNGSDDGTFIYSLLDNTANASLIRQNDDTGLISFVLNDTNPVIVGAVTEDKHGVQSTALFLEIWLCTGCSGHGTCIYTQERTDKQSTTYFKYAACNCSSYWSGSDCEIDFDGCAATPCSPLRNCTDNPATVHQALGRAYNCSSCPSGYAEGKNDTTKCEDINECNDNLHGCNQTCENTEGSYYCTCSSGFRLGQNTIHCDDINECQEGISGCDQKCINTYGGFNCTCHNGYFYNATRRACVTDGDNETACTSKNCSHGCTIDNKGNATCFCRAGYGLTDNGECKDINECEQNVCTQRCNNTDGSFWCSCLAGYTLGIDKVSCTSCSYLYYGDNCSEICNCGRGVLSCDPVRGCVCLPGWGGNTCENDIDECKQNQSICGDPLEVCTNTIGSYFCSCISGYESVNNACKDIDECSDPILNKCEQICSNTFGGYSCSCRSGYNINPSSNKSCIDIDECASDQSGCQQFCNNTSGRFSCSCHFGYELLVDRKTCKPVDDPCIKYGNLRCNQICIVDLEKETAVCGCNRGFRLGADNQTCIDIDECREQGGSLNKCSVKSNCKNTNGSYTCTCEAGFQLENDGRSCKECDNFHYGINCTNECGCGVGAEICDKITGCVCKNGWTGDRCDTDEDECSNMGVCSGAHIYCLNTPGSYQCLCEHGYTKDINSSCSDVDECDEISLNECAQLCDNTDGSYICSCQAGFLQNGTECEDIEECKGLNNCSQICTNTAGNYRCSCYEGFILNTTDKRSCLPADHCNESSATVCESNNAKCVFVNGSPQCYCPKGYENISNMCTDINECIQYPNRCSENCTNTNGSYACSCNAGKKIGLDGSTCVSCSEGQYGVQCAHNCSCNITNTNMCNKVNGSCLCKKGWTGSSCHEDILECNNSLTTCPEHSKCLELPGTYLCQCDIGYSKTSNGTCALCPTNRYGDSCKYICTCNATNTVTCDHISGFCTCKTGWEDGNCSKDVNECITGSSVCNGSNQTCNNTPGSYRCMCSPGYTIDINDRCIDIDECLEGIDSCTQGCVNTNGNYTCVCEAGYIGDGINCTDIDECFQLKHNCTQICKNTIGGYYCSCFSDHDGDVHDCEALEVYSVVLTFIFDFDLKSESLNNNATYNKYRSDVYTAISKYFKENLRNDSISIEIIELTEGSLKAKCRVRTPNTERARSSLLQKVLSAYTAPFVINGTNVTVKSIESNNQPISKDPCEAAAALNQGCKAGYECILQENNALCRPKIVDNFNLVVGLGVGIPLGILFVLVVIALVIYRKRVAKKEHFSDGSSYDERSRDSVHGFVSPGIIPTRFSGYTRSDPLSGPHQWETDSDMSSASLHRGLSIKRTGNPLYHGRTNGASDDHKHQRQRPNFSWDFISEFINPDETYEIKRPHTDVLPNPLYYADT